MGLKVRLAPRAIADLDEIRAYLVARDRRAAERVRRRIEQAIATLADFPGIGRPTHLAGVSVTTVLRYPSLVYYTVSDSELVIIHLHRTPHS